MNAIVLANVSIGGVSITAITHDQCHQHRQSYRRDQWTLSKSPRSRKKLQMKGAKYELPTSVR